MLGPYIIQCAMVVTVSRLRFGISLNVVILQLYSKACRLTVVICPRPILCAVWPILYKIIL